MLTESQEILINFIKKNEPVEQAKIIEEFLNTWGYKSKASARNGIGKLLGKLEDMHLIKKQKLNSGRIIKKNVWRVI